MMTYFKGWAPLNLCNW